MREIVRLFAVFAKIGCMTFGGGYAMLPVIERELAAKRGWAAMDDIMRYYTIAQVTPGVIAVNVATFVGYKRAGVAGGIAATLGFVLPSATMVVAVSFALNTVVEYPLVRHAFNGIRLAVGALVLDTVFRLLKKLPRKEAPLALNAASIVICAASCAASLVWNTHPVFIVAAAGLSGFLLWRK